jgi:hypothetical protein
MKTKNKDNLNQQSSQRPKLSIRYQQTIVAVAHTANNQTGTFLYFITAK